MQSFDELMSMDETALRSLAESMGMKKNSTDSKEEMAYFVIDNASAQVAREEAAKLKPRQKERKPRAKKSAAEPAATATLEPTGDAEPVAPKRRGRKPKAVVEAEKAAAAAGDADANVAQPATADNADQQLQPAKRRGRKPKAAVEEVPAEKNESSAPVAPEAVPVVKPKAVSSIIPGLEPDDLPLVLPVAPALKVAEKNVEAKEATPKEGRDVFVHQDNNAPRRQTSQGRKVRIGFLLRKCQRQDLHSQISATDPGGRESFGYSADSHCRTRHARSVTATSETAEETDKETAPAGTHVAASGQHAATRNQLRPVGYPDHLRSSRSYARRIRLPAFKRLQLPDQP